jgi:lysophospholipase L1-like esterase
VLAGLATLVMTLLLAASAPSSSLALPGDKGALSFGWTMPTRYESGRHEDGAAVWNGTAEVRPAGFRVDLSAQECGTTGTTTWLIEGTAVAAGDPNVVGGSPTSCALAYRFPREGSYEVAIEERDGSGELVARATQIVPVQDFLIVSIGDSVASGEGNPETPGTPIWGDRQCHRSAHAGPAQAAKAIEDADPRTSVTFLHLACSGTTIDAGLLGPYEGIEPGASLPPQLDALTKLVGDREVDALLVSIGANDVGFASLVRNCFVRPLCHLPGPGSAATRFAKKLPTLPGRYDALDARLDALGIRSERVHATEYFDPTRDDAGAFCDPEGPLGPLGGILGDHPASGTLLGISRDEAAWAADVVLSGLNAQVVQAASRHGWRFVGDIASQFERHGYCAIDHWVVRWSESKATQLDENGTLHPNGAGHGAYRDRLGAVLTSDLYADTGLQSPRRPQQRLELQGRLGDTGDFLDVVGPVAAAKEVTLRARVTGPSNAGRMLAFSLTGPGSLSRISATTDANGEVTLTYAAPDPITGDRARVAATLVEDGTTYGDTVAISFEGVQVSVSPTSATLKPGDQQQFTATVTGAANQAVTWTATGGTITPDGLYTAGETPGFYTVTATSDEDPSASATGSVTITSSAPTGVFKFSSQGSASTAHCGDPGFVASPPDATSWTGTKSSLCATATTSFSETYVEGELIRVDASSEAICGTAPEGGGGGAGGGLYRIAFQVTATVDSVDLNLFAEGRGFFRLERVGTSIEVLREIEGSLARAETITLTPGNYRLTIGASCDSSVGVTSGQFALQLQFLG